MSGDLVHRYEDRWGDALEVTAPAPGGLTLLQRYRGVTVGPGVHLDEEAVRALLVAMDSWLAGDDRYEDEPGAAVLTLLPEARYL